MTMTSGCPEPFDDRMDGAVGRDRGLAWPVGAPLTAEDAPADGSGVVGAGPYTAMAFLLVCPSSA